MAIYIDIPVRRREFVDETGGDLRINQGPPLETGGWGDMLLYYWACQINFHDNFGALVGQGHFGVQAYDLAELDRKSVINWGVYDMILGSGAVFRNSNVLTPNRFIDINSSVSYGFRWEYDHWYRFRCFRSPKQDWTAAEIRPGESQVPPYVDTDQQADEVAFRCTVQDVTTGDVPIEISDVLIKSAATSKPMTDGQWWTEPIKQATWGGNPLTDWPHSPEADVRHIDWDGAGMISQFEADYSVGAANCDVTAVTGPPGLMRMRGNTTQTNPDGTLIAVPANFWEAAQPNVAPTPDLTAPGTTPRPWF